MPSNTTTRPMTELRSSPGLASPKLLMMADPSVAPGDEQGVGEGVVVADDHGHGDGLPQGPAHGQDHGRLDPGARPGHHRGPHHLPPRGPQGPGRLAVLPGHAA